jgi:hypothetical protein
MELGKILYEEAAKKGQQPGAAPGGQAEPKPSGGAGGKDDVIDADFKVKEE